MNLTTQQEHLALYAVRDLIVQRIRNGNPIPAGMRRLCHDLEVASVRGSEPVAAFEQWKPDNYIDTAEAAAILGCSSRWVRVIRTDLDGHKISGRWAFRRQHVINYRNQKGDT